MKYQEKTFLIIIFSRTCQYLFSVIVCDIVYSSKISVEHSSYILADQHKDVMCLWMKLIWVIDFITFWVESQTTYDFSVSDTLPSIIIYRFITLRIHWMCKSVCNSSIFQLFKNSERTFYIALHIANIFMLAFCFSHSSLANELIKYLTTKPVIYNLI